MKGRAGAGTVEVSANEWAKACNLRDRYWLYVVYDCATPRPRLVKVRDPFGRLLATAKGSVVIAESDILSATMGEGERMKVCHVDGSGSTDTACGLGELWVSSDCRDFVRGLR